MTALAENSVTIVEKQDGSAVRYDLPVTAAVNCFQGAIMVTNGATTEPGATATGLVARGVCVVPADNSSGADGDLNVAVRTGVFGPFANNASSIAIANVGALCFIVDDNTVDLTDGAASRSAAGSIVDVTADGVFVAFTFPKAPLGT